MDPDLTNPEQIKQLITLLQGLLPKENSNVKKQNTKKTKTKSPKLNSKIKTKTRRLKNEENDSYNKFLEMPEMNMHKSDVEIDKKLCKHPPTQRNRAYEPIKAICRVCGKTESINPAILPESSDRYKCNKCSSSSG
jgi:hypothetical protein